MAEKFRVGVVGAGYVGLVTGACMAHIGHSVVCVDKNESRVASLRAGELPIYEPGLGEVISKNDSRLEFSSDLPGMLQEADIVFVAVDTPPGEDGAADLSNVAAVARSIGRALSQVERHEPLVVVNKSTVPVGSGDYVSMLVQEGAEEGGGGASYRVVSNPEFLREGSAVHDSLFPDRIVLGADSEASLAKMRELYRPIIEGAFDWEAGPDKGVAAKVSPEVSPEVPFVTTDLASAEMIKYAANAFLATKISFANEMANICERVGADVKNVAAGIGLDARIGPRFLDAGIGWGGSCFPKDVMALVATAREHEYEPAILNAAVSVNERQRRIVITKLQRDLHTLKGKRIALLGLAFKPNTDDLREAPSLSIARMLEARGARVVGYDPVAAEAAAEQVPSLKVVGEIYEALRGAHAAVIATEWREVRELDLERAAGLMEGPKLIIDGRNTLDPAATRAAGLLYQGFGRD